MIDDGVLYNMEDADEGALCKPERTVRRGSRGRENSNSKPCLEPHKRAKGSHADEQRGMTQLQSDAEAEMCNARLLRSRSRATVKLALSQVFHEIVS